MSGELVIAIINTTLYTSPHLLAKGEEPTGAIERWRPEPVHYVIDEPLSWVTSSPEGKRDESISQGPEDIHVFVQMGVNSSCLRQIVKMVKCSVNSKLGSLARMNVEYQLSDPARRRARKFPHNGLHIAQF
jgi:hypothetical protein